MKTDKTVETYPIQFRDKLDEYLWKEHHILGGCCSSVESLKYSIAREVAEKLSRNLSEKTCMFLIDKLKEIPMGGGKMKIKADCSLKDFIEDYENYIKEE